MKYILKEPIEVLFVTGEHLGRPNCDLARLDVHGGYVFMLVSDFNGLFERYTPFKPESNFQRARRLYAEAFAASQLALAEGAEASKKFHEMLGQFFGKDG